jgi:hypothetical protein
MRVILLLSIFTAKHPVYFSSVSWFAKGIKIVWPRSIVIDCFIPFCCFGYKAGCRAGTPVGQQLFYQLLQSLYRISIGRV